MRLFFVLVISMLLCRSALAEEYRLSVGLFGSETGLTSGDSALYPLQGSLGIELGYKPHDRWQIKADYTSFDLYNDTTASTSFSFSRDKDAATWRWKGKRISLMLSRRLVSIAEHLHFDISAGAGLIIWKEVDAEADTTRDATGPRNETIDFAASEVIVGLGSAIEVNISRRVTLGFGFRADYLTGGGADFAEIFLTGRHNWLYGLKSSITFSFSKHVDSKEGTWPSDEVWSQPVRRRPLRVSNQLDSDNDGVIDARDNCVNTPVGAIVDAHGCALDSDRDGVFDGLDDCPGTDRLAAGMVDISGCPVDSDFDGVPDYRDACPGNRIGAHVDETGCPTDADNDGVPDGLDDCPNTLIGVDVEPNGCIDLDMLSTPMVLNIDYSSGSFEIDPKTKKRLKQLVSLLTFVPAIRLDINGYTDNIGTAGVNQTLSDKRAKRVRDYLVTNGISSDRIKTFGRGETNFIASNQTASGRAKNRRIEIIFYK